MIALFFIYESVLFDCGGDAQLYPISGRGPVDFAIEQESALTMGTEAKKENVDQRFAQCRAQLDSSCS